MPIAACCSCDLLFFSPSLLFFLSSVLWLNGYCMKLTMGTLLFKIVLVMHSPGPSRSLTTAVAKSSRTALARPQCKLQFARVRTITSKQAAASPQATCPRHLQWGLRFCQGL